MVLLVLLVFSQFNFLPALSSRCNWMEREREDLQFAKVFGQVFDGSITAWFMEMEKFSPAFPGHFPGNYLNLSHLAVWTLTQTRRQIAEIAEIAEMREQSSWPWTCPSEIDSETWSKPLSSPTIFTFHFYRQFWPVFFIQIEILWKFFILWEIQRRKKFFNSNWQKNF